MSNDIISDRGARQGNIDLLRAFGIILMIMGHVGFGGIFDKWIHAFHMPMFFIISGSFINTDRDVLTHIKKRIKTLLIPYFFWGMCYEFLWSMMGRNQWLGLLFPNSIEIPINGALWFLPALFIADVVSFIILKYIRAKIAYVFMVIIAIFGNLHFWGLPFAADSAMVGVGLILIGYLLRKRCAFILILKLKTSCILLIMGSVFVFINNYVNMRTNEYAFIPLFWINATLITLALSNIFKWIDMKIDLKRFKEIGTQSMIYICMNQFILRIVNQFSVPYTGVIGKLSWKIIQVVVVVFVCFLANRLINRSRFKIVLGKA